MLPYDEICIFMALRITRFVYVPIVDGKDCVVARLQQPLRIVRGINTTQQLPDV